ncbi:DMT family transporter [Mycoplasma sp. Mirounga ES2805-ORL]|uniref:DMT family transporter n=1 Tax=Mycoplasma sp. Mirounga ES2805-ORL TaxID=754514 RepID=UPI00197BE56B|nr:DMT family transporter [Mycoplasma sp. Mirounga ES2805-ORL]QSF13440.1 DMT family transporter [Mycoplasma sp. Mirounga ES2805-ORL]
MASVDKLKNIKNKISDVHDEFTFKPILYKRFIKNESNNKAYSELWKQSKYEVSKGLYEYISNLTDSKKNNILKKRVKKVEYTYFPVIIFFLIISLVFSFIMIPFAYSGKTNDILIIILSVLTFASVVGGVISAIFYFLALRKVQLLKNKYYAKCYSNSIKLEDLKKIVFENSGKLKFLGNKNKIEIISQMKFPDLPEDTTVAYDPYSQLYSYKGITINVQNIQLSYKQEPENIEFNEELDKLIEQQKINNKVNLDKEVQVDTTENKDDNKIETILTPTNKKIKVINMNLLNSEFNTAFIPFHIFNEFSFYKQKFQDISFSDKNIDKLFKFKSINQDLSKIKIALEEYACSPAINKMFVPENSSINYYNNVVEAILAMPSDFEFDYDGSIPFNDITPVVSENKFEKDLSDDTSIPNYLIVKNFDKFINYFTTCKYNVIAHVYPIIYYLIDPLSQIKQFNTKSFNEIFLEKY